MRAGRREEGGGGGLGEAAGGLRSRHSKLQLEDRVLILSEENFPRGIFSESTPQPFCQN